MDSPKWQPLPLAYGVLDSFFTASQNLHLWHQIDEPLEDGPEEHAEEWEKWWFAALTFRRDCLGSTIDPAILMADDPARYRDIEPPPRSVPPLNSLARCVYIELVNPLARYKRDPRIYNEPLFGQMLERAVGHYSENEASWPKFDLLKTKAEFRKACHLRHGHEARFPELRYGSTPLRVLPENATTVLSRNLPSVADGYDTDSTVEDDFSDGRPDVNPELLKKDRREKVPVRTAYVRKDGEIVWKEINGNTAEEANSIRYISPMDLAKRGKDWE